MCISRDIIQLEKEDKMSNLEEKYSGKLYYLRVWYSREMKSTYSFLKAENMYLNDESIRTRFANEGKMVESSPEMLAIYPTYEEVIPQSC